jgi:DNA (cytosine-5)-methyltransferase 1
VFVIATREPLPAHLVGESPFRTRGVAEAQARLPADLARAWIDWRLPAPAVRNADLASLLDTDASWRPPARTAALLDLMSPLHRARVEALRAAGGRGVGAVFRRMRIEAGQRVQRAEVRFDGLAGCLRTPRGGSSRQTVLLVEGGQVKSRLVTPREGARLMGLPEGYQLPAAATSALHVVGDGVAVPVVAWLAAEILQPLLQDRHAAAAA